MKITQLLIISIALLCLTVGINVLKHSRPSKSPALYKIGILQIAVHPALDAA